MNHTIFLIGNNLLTLYTIMILCNQQCVCFSQTVQKADLELTSVGKTVEARSNMKRYVHLHTIIIVIFLLKS